jgi:hypothetical protein
MKNNSCIMFGVKSMYEVKCFNNTFTGAGFDI